MCVCVCVCAVIMVEGSPKTPFSIDVTPKCKVECNSFPWIALLTLPPYRIMLSVKQEGSKNHL